MNLDWIAVGSPRIKLYAYDPEEAVILVVFREDEKVWAYADCEPVVWEHFQDAHCKGRFIDEVLAQHDQGPP